MKKIVFILITLTTFLSYAQKKDKALIKSNDFVYEGNELVNDDFASAEMEYRKAISEKPTSTIGAYNLGNAYYKNQRFGEALLRHQEVIESATTKEEKHKAYHNMGNALMQGKQCKEAVEAFKNALRNNPNDDETRYNLGLAKECSKQQGGGGGGEDENKEENQDQEKQEQNPKEDPDKEDNKEKKDEGDENKENNEEGEEDEQEKEGEDKEDEDGKPKDENKDEGKGEDKKKEQPKPQQGQLSPQQIKNLLEAMNDQEQKVQDKINAQKEKEGKGAKVKNVKDW